MVSGAFFTGMAMGSTLARTEFARPAAWRMLDALIALVMWTIAASLLI